MAANLKQVKSKKIVRQSAGTCVSKKALVLESIRAVETPLSMASVGFSLLYIFSAAVLQEVGRDVIFYSYHTYLYPRGIPLATTGSLGCACCEGVGKGRP